MKKLLLIILLSLPMGCSATNISTAYLEADRKTFDAVNPDLTGYYLHDPALSSEDRDIKLKTLKRWQDRLEYFEKLDKEGNK